MYKQLTSEQRSQIFALLQRKSPRKEIARIVGISQSTLWRELKRNSTNSGKYIKYRHRPKYKAFPIADRTSIHQRSKQADGTRFGDFEMNLIVDLIIMPS